MSALFAISASAFGPTPAVPFRIKIVRDTKATAPLNYFECIPGKMYIAPADFRTPPDRLPEGAEIGDTLELPWKDNAGYVSAVPAARYKASVYVSPNLGWTIRLTGTTPRSSIEIHVGSGGITNTTNTEGCIIPGRRTVCPTPVPPKTNPGKLCCLRDSPFVRDAIKTNFGVDNTRPIEVLIVE